MTKNVNIVNRKAHYDYEFLDSYSCGLVLYGAEVKAIRNGHISLAGTFCYIDNGEVWIKNSYIKCPETTTRYGKSQPFEETRPRKLLLTRKEIRKLTPIILQKGYSLVPYRVYSYKGLLKCEVKLCRGKKDYDKRESMKERDLQMEMKRNYG